jgi:hypothetical protein
MDKKSNENKVFKMFSRKAKEYTENKEIEANIYIFYELFRLTLVRISQLGGVNPQIFQRIVLPCFF